ncbi:hypothetical protein [Geminicoccus harenae]|uniref:hypothetical protein n=1 Tax=Geminicoccus harenae TaxID=2498453 RepID=UPI00168AFCA2|nr:hypothetical protein [Geminicoccus harenae]
MPRTPSPAQIEASRRNGARSRGPASPEGRAIAARNALRHGLCARTIRVLPAEDEASFHRLRTALLDRCAGDDDPLRICLAELLADNVWRQFRLSRQETAHQAQLLFDADDEFGAYEHPEHVVLDDHYRLLQLARYRAQHLREFKDLLASLGQVGEVPSPIEPAGLPEAEGRLEEEPAGRSQPLPVLRNEPEPPDDSVEPDEPDTLAPAEAPATSADEPAPPAPPPSEPARVRKRHGSSRIEPSAGAAPDTGAPSARPPSPADSAQALRELAHLREQIAARWPTNMRGHVEAFYTCASAPTAAAHPLG